MSELIVLRGVPASGKSTWAIECAAGNGHVRVNRDDIRFALFGAYWGDRVNEDTVTAVENAAVESSLAEGRDVVLDATNLRNKSLVAKLSIAALYGASVRFIDFPVSLDEALRRNAGRERQVPESAIRGFFQRYRINEVTGVLRAAPTPLPTFEPYRASDDTGARMAYVVDTDGTVANHAPHRSPFDTTKYHLDTPIQHVINVVHGLSREGYTIIGLSGRDEQYYDVTESWWHQHGMFPDAFFMRPQGDNRMDAIVKYELFKEYIEPNYHVLGAFDDRPQVIRMWKTIGVPVFDVGPGKEF